MKYFFYLIIFSIIFTSCDSSDLIPKSRFQGEIPYSPKNPTRLFSEEFVIIDQAKNGFSENYRVEFEKKKKYATIIEKEKNDTVFRGYSYKNRGIWYFSFPLTDSTYWLSGLKIEDDFILGWPPFPMEQMYMVDSLIENNVIFLDTLDSKFTIVPTKNNNQKLYQKILENSPKRFLIKTQSVKRFNPSRRAKGGGKNTISNITPNMDEGYIDVTVQNTGTYSVELFHEEGAFAKKLTVVDTDLIHIDVDNLDEGFYFLEINDLDQGHLLVKSKIYVDN